jgi:hypothetical protein
MGPWFIRDEGQPFRPGCNYDTVLSLLQRGRITPETALRGPTTGQFWRQARHVPGIGHLFGRCHACEHGVSPDAEECPQCGASFAVPRERQELGLGPVQRLPAPGGRPAAASAEPRQPAPAAGPVPGPSSEAGAPAATRRGPAATRPTVGAGPGRVGHVQGPSPGQSRLVTPPTRSTPEPRQAPRQPAAAMADLAGAAAAADQPAQPQPGPAAATRRTPAAWVTLLGAAALLLAVAVVVGAVFSTELSGFWAAAVGEAKPEEPAAAEQVRSKQPAPESGGVSSTDAAQPGPAETGEAGEAD